MDILIRARTGKQYQLLRQDKPTRQINAVYQTPDQLKNLLAGAEPLSPSTWPALWQQIRSNNDVMHGNPSAIVQALQDLASKRLLHIVPFEPQRKKISHNCGASCGSGGAGGGSGNGVKHTDLGELPPVGAPAAKPPPAVEKTFSDDAAATSDAPAAGNDPPVKECKTEGEPISMISGEELLQLTDCVLPGPVPFSWTRTYRSTNARDAGLGFGWTFTGSERLVVDAQQVIYHDSDGREVPLKLPRVLQRSRYIPEGLILDRISKDAFLLKQDGYPDRLFARYGDRSSHFRLTQLRHSAYVPSQNVLGVAQPESGFVIHLHYNELNQLTQLQGNWGKGLLLRRGSDGRIARIELQNRTSGACKTLVEYDYDANGDLIAQRNAKGVGEKYQYRNHLIQKRTLATGFNFYFEWDGDDSNARCTHQWGDRGIYDYHFEWQPDQQRSKAIDSRGKVREYQYNEYGQIIAELDCEGGLHQYAYERGRKRRYTDPEGNTTEYFYDRHNNPLGYRDPLGNRVVLGWFKGKPTSIIDKDKSQWRRQYDSKGQLVALIDPFSQITRYTYNRDGLIASVTDPLQRTTRYEWSDSGELKNVIDPEGHQRYIAYDHWGQIATVEIILADGNSPGPVHFFYTPTGQLEKIVAPNGDTTTYTYNENDQLVRHSDPQGRTTEFKYDGLSQVIERVDPEGHRLKYEYDSERNLSALINENGEKYQFFYDGNERLIKEVGFDGRVQQYEYDKAGRLIRHLDAGEVTTEFERDALGQLLTRTSCSINQPSLEPEITRFRYDPKGRLLESYNADQFISFTYNAFGNLTKEHHSDLNAQRQRISASMVDIGFSNVWPGKRSGIQLPDGQRIDYGFDANNRLNQITFNGEIIARLERDMLGREVGRAQGDLITLSENDGRLQKQTSYSQSRKTPGPIQREYGYDAFGNVNRVSDGPEETRYAYDLLNRLKKAEGKIPETFSFDPAGNLLQSGDGDTANNSSVKGNRLYTQGDRKFTYDARGNLIQENRGKEGKLVTTFEYNLSNQLVKTTRDGQATTYAYDPIGRRISKTDSFGTTRYLWAGDQMVQEQRNNLKKTYIFEPESFRPVAQISDGKTYHYHLDHLGTPRELTDDNGKIVWKVLYKTYGNVAVKEVEEVENNLRFQGQYFDEETGLHYNRFRYYNPNTGQFVTQDPIGLLGGVNNYQYAPNPVGWVDPLGLSCKESSWLSAAKNGFDLFIDVNKKIGKYGLGTAEIVASGAWSSVLEIGGGLVSLPFLLKGVDEAVAVQERIAQLSWTPKSSGAQAIVEDILAPVGTKVGKGIDYARSASEDKIGIGATAIIFGTVDAAWQIGGLLTGTKSIQAVLKTGKSSDAPEAQDGSSDKSVSAPSGLEYAPRKSGKSSSRSEREEGEERREGADELKGYMVKGPEVMNSRIYEGGSKKSEPVVNNFLSAYSANARVLLRESLASQAGIPRNIREVWGSSIDDIVRSLEMDGATFVRGKRASSNALSLKVSGHPIISEVVIHPGGGTHVGPYYKFDMKDGSQIKIIDPNNYRPKTIQDKTIFYNQQGEQISFVNGKWIKNDVKE